MSRLFTFGCSFTRYHWPTWADILGQSFDKFYNWGNRGAGNAQIFHRLSECIVKETFDNTDVIVVQWTDYHRFDFHNWNKQIPESWYVGGNLLLDDPTDMIKALVYGKTWNEKSYQLYSYNLIHGALALVKNLNCKVIFVMAHDLRQDVNTDDFLNYKDLFTDTIWVDKDLYNWTCNNNDMRLSFLDDYVNNKSVPDMHPTPMMYYHWLDKFSAPRLNLKIDEDFSKKMQLALENTKSYYNIGDRILNAGYDTNQNYVRGY